MKSARHQAILDLIEKHPIDRQEDLLAHLREEGFDVTQATVSRDIRDLQLVKVADADGHYRYMPAAASGKVTHSPSRFEMIFRESVLKVDYAGLQIALGGAVSAGITGIAVFGISNQLQPAACSKHQRGHLGVVGADRRQHHHISGGIQHRAAR